jgi:hypothetical protein
MGDEWPETFDEPNDHSSLFRFNKHEIRKTKYETNSNDQNSKFERGNCFGFALLNIRICFEFGFLNFEIN